MLRKAVVGILAVLCAAVAPIPASAQTAWPAKPIKIVVPYTPGGASDITTRFYAQGLTEILGQQVVVENKPGGGTNIAAEYVARSAPDGYTLYVANFASHAVNRHLFKSLPFDPVKDFTHVAMMNRAPLFLCVKPGSPFKTAGEIAEHGRKNPGKLTYGSTGNGSPNHISGENLKHLGKFDSVHVPYKGAAELNADLLAGQIDYAFDASVIAHHRSGKIKCIGVTTAKTWGTDPDIAPIADTVPGFDLLSFFGIVGPAKIPADIVQKLNDAFVQVAKKPEMVSKLAVSGGIPYGASLKETQEFLTDVDQRWGPLVKATGAKVD
jgi:tripartite-type tricarboxylate transporter receptor subunit TctC